MFRINPISKSHQRKSFVLSNVIVFFFPVGSVFPSRDNTFCKLNIYFGGLFTELTMSSLRNLFRILFLQTVLLGTAMKEGKFIWFIV